MSADFYLIDGINPEPWESPEVNVVRKGGKYMPHFRRTESHRSYQEAIKEEAEKLLAENPPTIEPPYKLELFFWRQVTRGDYEGKIVSGHVADATNLQKCFEDALQGTFLTNDRYVQDVHSVIMEQSADVEPRILFCVSQFYPVAYAWTLDVIRELVFQRAPNEPRTNVLPADPEPLF